MNLFKLLDVENESEISIFNLPILKYGKKSNENPNDFYIDLFPNKSIKDEVLDDIIKRYPDIDDYYIFTSRSGEFWLLMHHINEILKKNKSKKYLFIFKKKYHANIFKMLHPENKNFVLEIIPSICKYLYITDNINIKYKKKRFYFPVYTEYFLNVEKQIRTKNKHYYDLLKKHLGIKELPENLTPAIDKGSEEKVEKLISEKLGSNFIFISPESLSNKKLSNDFWLKLTKKIKNAGYNIFLNITDYKNYIKNTISEELSFAEAYMLVKYSKAVIGLRSGFIETLTKAENIDFHIIYTEFPQRGKHYPKLDASKVLNGFSLKNLPIKNKERIYEYDTDSKNESEILNEILKSLQIESEDNDNI